MRKSKLERIKEFKRKQGDAIRIGENGEDPTDGLLRVLLGGRPLPTQRAFIFSNERKRAYKGPAGCAKTSTICAAGILRALWQPGSVGLVARYDYNDLVGTTAGRMQQMLERLPEGILIDRDKSPPMRWSINPIGGGEPSTIYFMGLKDNKGSYEFNWAILDEADEIEEQHAMLVDGRLRAPGGNYALMLAFNPPDKHHWLYTACTGRDFQERTIKDPWLKCFEPLPNENAGNLPSDYYDSLRKTYTPDMVQRLIDGEWGSTFEGQPVYREFNYGIHVKDGLKDLFDPNRPLLRFWDFGYQHPYCMWAQIDWLGRMICFSEKLGDKIEATAFARQCKAETALRFPHAKDILDYGDPAVAQHKDTGKTLAEFAKEGITIHYRRSGIDEGVRLIRQTLTHMIDGTPAIQFDRRGMAILIAGLRGGYRMDDKGFKPYKDGYYDHGCDAFRYGCVNVLGAATASTMAHRYLPRTIEYNPRFDNEWS